MNWQKRSLNLRRFSGSSNQARCKTERVGAALEALGAAVGVDASRLRGELRGGFCHDWQSDPFARGAYSYAGVGGRRAGTELAAPVDSTLFFAGEATQIRRAQRDGPRRHRERTAGGEAGAGRSGVG